MFQLKQEILDFDEISVHELSRHSLQKLLIEKIIRGHLGSPGVKLKGQFSTLSDFKGWGVKLFVLNQRSKVSMVTSSSDLSFRGQRSKKGLIWVEFFNFNRFQRLRCQIVCLEPTIKSVHSDLFVRPFLQGSKVKERSYMGWIFNFNRFQRLRCQIVCLEPTIKSVHCDLFVRPFLQGSKVKERSYMGWIFNFNRFQRLRCQIVCLEPTIKKCPLVTSSSDLSFRGQRSKKGLIWVEFSTLTDFKD